MTLASKIEPVDKLRPTCPTCNLAMWFFSELKLTPSQGNKYEWTYICEVCGATKAVLV